jgi:hypothetical protein
VACAVGLSTLAAAYGMAGDASLSWLQFHEARGLHVATTYASAMMLAHGLGLPIPAGYDYGSLDVHLPWGEPLAHVAPWVMLGLFALTLWRYARHLRSAAGLWRGATAMVVAMLIGNKVFSPQYVLWIIPLASMAAASGRRFDTKLAGLLLLACGLTAAVHPGEDLIAAGDVVRQLALVARNGALVALWGALLVRPEPHLQRG